VVRLKLSEAPPNEFGYLGKGATGKVEARLDSLEDKFAKKLQETKPIWVVELNDRIDVLSGKVDQTDREVRDLSYAFSTITTDIAGLRATQLRS